MNKRKLAYIVIISAIATALSFFQHTSFWIVIFFYGLFVYLLLNFPLSKGVKRAVEICLWSLFVISMVAGYIANHNYPKGPEYSTGDYVCENDDRGPCHEQFIEDTRNLNVPVWVKYFKSSAGELTWMGLLFAGIACSVKKDESED